MSRFRPMAATQAGREGGDCEEGERSQRAQERQLLRERERARAGARERARGQQRADRLTQTSREEVRRFQGTDACPPAHEYANIKDLSQWLAASVGRGLDPANGRQRRQRGRGNSCSCVRGRRGEAGVGTCQNAPGCTTASCPPPPRPTVGLRGLTERYPQPLTSRFPFLGKCSFQPH